MFAPLPSPIPIALVAPDSRLPWQAARRRSGRGCVVAGPGCDPVTFSEAIFPTSGVVLKDRAGIRSRPAHRT